MLALRDIAHNLLRFLLTSLGIGLLTAGTLTINGIYNGVVEDALNLVDRFGPVLWVVEKGSTGPFDDGSQVDIATRDAVAATPGVQTTRRFDLLAATTEHDGRDVDITLLAVDYPLDTGRWLPLTAGLALNALRGTAVVDVTAGFSIGDRLVVNGETVRVVGLMSGMLETNGEPIVAVSGADFDAMRRGGGKPVEPTHTYKAEGARWPSASTVSAILAETAPGFGPSAVAQRIGTFNSVSVFTAEDQRSLIVNGRLSNMRLQILVFSGLLTVITAVVVTLTIYTMTVEKQHTIALLKLIGAPPRMISGLILSQAFLLAVFGLLAGLALQQMLAPLFPRRVLIQPGDLVVIAAAISCTCALGSGLGIYKATTVRAQEILS